jgi:hypothetical protein
VPNVQGCTVAVAEGMRVTTQRGARAIDLERTDAAFAIDDSTVQALDATPDEPRSSTSRSSVRARGPRRGDGRRRVRPAVALFDEQAGPGGQIHRGIARSPLARADVLGADYWAGGALVRAFERSGARYVPGRACGR